MKDKKQERINELLDNTASANEQTGALQHIEIDTKEIKLFHSKFNDEK